MKLIQVAGGAPEFRKGFRRFSRASLLSTYRATSNSHGSAPRATYVRRFLRTTWAARTRNQSTGEFKLEVGTNRRGHATARTGIVRPTAGLGVVSADGDLNSGRRPDLRKTRDGQSSNRIAKILGTQAAETAS